MLFKNMAALLARAKLFRISRSLFRNDDGSPRVFYSDFTSDDLTQILHKGGGYLIDKAEDAEICLCEKKTDNRITDGYIPLDFVVDCVKRNYFLNLDKYRLEVLGLKATTSSGQASTSREEIPDFLSSEDEDMFRFSNACNIKVRTSDLAGRKKYSDVEDFKIIKYLILHNKYSETGGNAVWKLMESLKITEHTHQSMKARFKKKILPEIDTYDIPADWKAKLLGVNKAHISASSPDSDGLVKCNSTFSALDDWKEKEKQHRKNWNSCKDAPENIQCNEDIILVPDETEYSLDRMIQEPFLPESEPASNHEKSANTTAGCATPSKDITSYPQHGNTDRSKNGSEQNNTEVDADDGGRCTDVSVNQVKIKHLMDKSSSHCREPSAGKQIESETEEPRREVAARKDVTSTVSTVKSTNPDRRNGETILLAEHNQSVQNFVSLIENGSLRKSKLPCHSESSSSDSDNANNVTIFLSDTEGQGVRENDGKITNDSGNKISKQKTNTQQNRKVRGPRTSRANEKDQAAEKELTINTASTGLTDKRIQILCDIYGLEVEEAKYLIQMHKGIFRDVLRFLNS